MPNELLIGSLNTKENNIPSQFYLYQNYPNPFNPMTRINYDIPRDGYVSISIFDITGRKIISLVNENKIRGFTQHIGTVETTWGKLAWRHVYLYY